MEIQPLHTKVEKTIQIKLGVIVLEHPSGFPYNDTNLYCVASDDKVVWKAEKPDANTLFSRVRVNEDGDTLSAYTVHGHACELVLKTGKLISYASIK
ncbi:MAG: hypothetical protein IT314_09275 [Anaerolineales bacterium]|nr:hypothetical protein [Anaerolineales bacterium]